MALTFNQVKPTTVSQEQVPAPKNETGMANVTIRVDADCFLLCDGEFMEEIEIVANQIKKAQLPIGQHILEFIDATNPDVKLEKVVDFPEDGKNYLVLIKGLQEAGSKAKENAAKAEAEKQMRLEAERKAKEEAERKAKEEAERKRKEDAERLAAEKKRKEEEERKRIEAEYARTHGEINGHEYVDLGLSVKWATCNVGASTPVGYGGNYAWGETKEKDDYYWSNYKWYNCSDGTMTKYCRVDYKTVLDPNDDVAHVKWGGSWRMPTKAEQDELRAKCTWTETTQNGVKGCKVTGPNGNSIFLPAVPSGHYWSISLYDDDTEQAYFLSCNGCNGWGSRCIGSAVRPVSE